jgi:hypothetical protein
MPAKSGSGRPGARIASHAGSAAPKPLCCTRPVLPDDDDLRGRLCALDRGARIDRHVASTGNQNSSPLEVDLYVQRGQTASRRRYRMRVGRREPRSRQESERERANR